MGLALPAYVGGEENRVISWVAGQLRSGAAPANPVVFFGPVSSGKSMLLQAIRDEWHEHQEGPVLFTTGTDFARHYADAIETDSVAEFRSKLFRSKLLIVDDLHFIAGKPAVQQEWILLLDQAEKAGLTIVVSMDLPPNHQPGLTNKLASRLSGGIAVRIHLPAVDTRRAIVDLFLEHSGLSFPDEVTQVIAGQHPDTKPIFHSVPELRHAILEIQEKAEQAGRQPSLEDANALLQQELSARKPAMETIIKHVTRHLNISVRDLKSASRRQCVVRARGMVFYLARMLTEQSYEQLGEALGGRDHSTVIHACRRIEALIKSDAGFANTLERLVERLADEVELGRKAGSTELQYSTT